MTVSGTRTTARHRRRLAWAVALGLGAALLAPASSATARTIVPSAATAPVAGAQTSGDSLFPHQGNGGYDATHYDLALTYAASGSITATATISATTTGAPLSSYSFDLQGLTVSAVSVDGAAATFTRIADTTTGAYKLVVTPATPVSGAFTTVVAYSGTPVAHTDPDGSKEGWTTTATGAVALGEPVGTMTWLPCDNTPSDKATFTTHFTIPTLGLANAAVGNGVLVSKVAAGTNTTWTWNQTHQQTMYLALLAIGNYSSAESDFTPPGGSPIHEWSYLSQVAAAVPGNTTVRETIPSVLTAIGAHYGTFPGTSYGIVVDNTTLGYALETQDRPYFETSVDEDTLIHEYAHQWYGDNVSPYDWNDVWLNEGPATFIATQVGHELGAGDDTTANTYFDLWNTTAASDADWTVPPAHMTDSADLFGWQVYNRGAMTLEALREAVGQTTFQQIMDDYQTTYAGQSGKTSQFIAIADRDSGYDLTAFFQDWLYDGDKPAWPSMFDLGLTSTPATGGQVAPGDTVPFTLTTTNTGKVPMTDSVITADLSGLAGVATVDPSTLPAGVTISGSTLTWTVPTTALGATSSVTFDALVSQVSARTPLTVTTRAQTLGSTCGTCTSTVTVVPPATATPTAAIGGIVQVGHTLTAQTGATASGAALAYQWRRNGTAISGATARTYRLTAADLRAVVTVRVSATAPGSSPASVISSPTAKVALGRQTLKPVPVIHGKAVVGRSLRVTVGKHDPGVTTTFQWYAAGHLVQHGGSHLKLTKAERGTRITVVCVAAKPGYATVGPRSEPTAVVRS